MDNVVQNINIEDIIPSNFQPSKEEENKIIELAQLIKNFGIIDPLLVRPKNGKYEIVLGIDSYQAAKIAGLNSIPALIKEIDDNIVTQYRTITNLAKENDLPKEKEFIPNNNLQDSFSKENSNIKINNYIPREKNNDIVNLSELNKKEYEREEIKMNNDQLNNNMMNNNLGQQTPTFGGRFFPSLEDEPTNMNMGGIQSSPMAPLMTNNNLNSNLIDLTDISMEKEPNTPTSIPNQTNPSMVTPNQNLNQSFSNVAPMPTNPNILPEEQMNQLNQPVDNIINLENLNNNNQPTPMPINSEQINAAMPELAQDFSNVAPTTNIPQFDMSQNMNINPQNIQENNMNPINKNIPQFDLNENQGSVPINLNQEIPTINNFNTNPPIEEPQFTTNNINTYQEIPTTQKDITPVVNTIKSLASNLESFGYKIMINEEDLPTTKKIIIEIEK